MLKDHIQHRPPKNRLLFKTHSANCTRAALSFAHTRANADSSCLQIRGVVPATPGNYE